MSTTNRRRGAESDAARTIAGHFAAFDRHRRVLGQRSTALGTADLRLLWLLTDREPRTLRQISEALGLEQSTVNRQVNAAITADLVTRSRDGTTGPYLFTISGRGTEEFEHHLDVTLNAYRDALDALGPRSADFIALMGEFLEAYGEIVTPARSAGT